ncbi:MAG: ATP-binding protein [Roseburia intestinalis]
MQEKGIHSDIKIDNVDLSYIEPIDITTIFGNLLDNAIEAAANADGDKYIFIKISAYHKMTVVHIENSCGKVKWKKRMPVSDKGKGRGIGLLNVKQSIDKYDGDLQLKQDGNRFVADLFLNS